MICASVYLLVFIRNLLVHLAEKILLLQPLKFGGDYHGDAYDVDLGFPFSKAGLQRDFVKSLVVIMLNAESKQSGFKAIRQKYRSDAELKNAAPILTNEFLEKCIETILKSHPFLQGYIGSSKGKEIFLLDSNIARDIIAKSLDAEIVVLPIHDGFVCKVTDEEKLRSIMQNAWSQRFGTTIPIKREF